MKVGSWDPVVTGHLWSLSVEEQFYLLWPAVILLVSKRRLVWVLAAGAVTAVIYRWLMTFTSVAYPDIGTPAALDALCLGGALAYARHVGVTYLRMRAHLWMAAAFALVTFGVLERFGDASLRFTFVDLCFAIVFTALVAAVDDGVKGRFGKLLEAPPLLFVGRISYGIYLYHLFVAYIVIRAATHLGFDLPQRGIVTFLTVSALTIVAATISWVLIEKPLASWKQRFPYSADKKEVPMSREQVLGL